MPGKEPTGLKLIAKMTGLKRWKVSEVLANNKSNNIHRVSDDETAIVLHAAAEIGYVNSGRGNKVGKKFNAVTIADVAKRAGVSSQAVRKAFANPPTQISPENRKFILLIAKELGYKPTFKSQTQDFYKRKTY